MSDRNEINKEAKNLRTLALGGRSTLTIEHTRNGERRHVTLRITKGSRGPTPPFFVSIFTGTDNTDRHHYQYAGCIWTHSRGRPIEPRFNTSAKSRFSSDDARVDEIRALVDVMNGEYEFNDTVKVYHEGRCAFCGRELTQPESVERGYGPECASNHGLPYGETSKPISAGGSTDPRLVSALDVDCPVTKCGARAGERCRRPRNGRRVVSDHPHKCRFDRAKKAASEHADREPMTDHPKVIDDRVNELLSQGWRDAEAARRQAHHEADGFTRWLPEHGLPSAAIRDDEGRDYDLDELEDDDDDAVAA